MHRYRAAIATSVIALITVSVSAQTATQLTGDALLQALLAEMRALRTTLQRNSAYDIRARLLLDRAKMYSDTIRELSRELENSSDFTRPVEVDTTMETESTIVEANIEARAAAITDPDQRKKMLEREKAMLERRKEMEMRSLEQLRLRFQRMENRLAEEKEKLRLVEEELAQIQRELRGEG